MRAITTLRLLNTSWEEESHQYYNNFSLFFIDPFQTDNRKIINDSKLSVYTYGDVP